MGAACRIGSGLVGAVALTLAAAGVCAGELRATIGNVKPQQGKLWVALYDGADAYRAERRFAGQILEASGTEVTAVFAGLPAGRYGVAVFQDRNGDSVLTTNLLGVPREPYGFSGGATGGAFGPPAFDAFALEVPDGGTVTTMVPLTE
ncbi:MULTISPECIES: DUF2141 domain-containing protein [Azospirillum]|nr:MULTISPECIES: DUF2141 domain-containing protein [Azospirillum]MDW7552655.1 DUF2141 domain-containing protein [Azospirillum brasilense]MDW7592153.1 DUF2141 domain-containing protein [Azospirillum brasilense]MDW7627284.1 DUF2141 domain-containing protein [Azospirillum brasilense]MDX5955027.1 DUF2141 domain-containing protein [Azospirillum brasilense]PWC93786.1 hypothetical protein AEJ54_11400 [Azospirillum sp. Sp 7]